MARTTPTQTILLNSTLFNYEIDGDGYRIWLEDPVTKRQWQWLAGADTKTTDPIAVPQRLPTHVYVAVVKNLFETGPNTSSLWFADLYDEGSSRLFLDVDLDIDYVCGWSAWYQFVLEPLPLASTADGKTLQLDGAAHDIEMLKALCLNQQVTLLLVQVAVAVVVYDAAGAAALGVRDASTDGTGCHGARI